MATNKKKLTRKGTMIVTVDEAQELLGNPHLWCDPELAKKKQEQDDSVAAVTTKEGGDTDEEKVDDDDGDFAAAGEKKKEKKKRPAKKANPKKSPAKKKAKKPTIEIIPPTNTSLAYEFAGQLVLDRMTGAEKEKLSKRKPDDLLFIQGSADQSEKVATVVNVPFKLISPTELDSADLSRPFEQSIYVNCMAMFSEKGIQRLKEFVDAGGLLVTTDHAIEQLTRVFPGIIETGPATPSTSVDVRVTSFGHSVLQGFLDEDVKPQWQMAGGSYSIKVVAKDKVDVLLVSEKLKEIAPAGEGAVVVTFTSGMGRVYHLTSHFFLQGSGSYSEMKASEYAKRKMASAELVAKFEAEEANKNSTLNKGTVQAATTIVEFLMRSILEHPQAPAAPAAEAPVVVSSTSSAPTETPVAK